MKYSITGHQRLTDGGKLGVGLLLVTPFVSGIAWAVLAHGLRSGDGIVGPALVIVAAGLAFLAGIILVIVGRTYHFVAEEIVPKAETKG